MEGSWIADCSIRYCNILCGVIRGALEMVNLRVECDYLKCTLWGDETTEIRVRLYLPLPIAHPAPISCCSPHMLLTCFLSMWLRPLCPPPPLPLA